MVTLVTVGPTFATAPPEDVTVYPVMADAPGSLGAVQLTVTEPTPASALTLVGGPGVLEGDGDGDGVGEGEADGVEDGLGVAVGVGDGDGGGGPITRGTRFKSMPLPEPPLIA